MSTDLPPLPEPELTCWYGPSSEFHEEHMFSADQMREYGQRCAVPPPAVAPASVWALVFYSESEAKTARNFLLEHSGIQAGRLAQVTEAATP